MTSSQKKPTKDLDMTGKGSEDRSGLLSQGEGPQKGRGRMSAMSIGERVNTGVEFKHHLAQSAKSEYHNLVGHHEPNAADAYAEKTELEMSWSQNKIWTLIHHWTFEALAAGVIISNAFVMGVAAELNIEENNNNPSNKAVVSNSFVDIMGYCFFAFYSIELLLRLWALRCRFFTGGEKIWNCLDLLLVLTAVYDVIEKEIIGGTSGSNMSFFRMIRLLKMMKMLRVFRVMKFFRELRVMMYAIVGSMRLLFWAMIMLSLITYMFSLVFLQGVNQYLTSDNVDPDVRSEALLYWGSVGTSMVTLYEAISGGNDWSPLAAPLRPCGDFYYYLFLFYIAFLTVTVLNVLTGVVVDAAMNIAQIDGDNVTDEFMCNQLADHDRIHELVDSIELNGDGFIQWEELVAGREKENIQNFLENMDIDLEEVEGFYRLMQCAGKEGRVKTAEFIKGCGNLKLWGASKSIESFLLMKDLSRLKRLVNLNNQKILACFAKQGIEPPEEDDNESVDDMFVLPADYAAESVSLNDPWRSDNWSQLVDTCTDVTLLNDISGRIAQRMESLNRQASNQKPAWNQKNKKVRASPAGQRNADEPGVPEESVTKLASLIVKEAMPQLLQEVEKMMRIDGGDSYRRQPSSPEPKLFGAPADRESLPSEVKDSSEDFQGDGSQTQAAKGKKKFKGFNKGVQARPSSTKADA